MAEHTHHFPKAWKGRCHTDQVRQEFAQLYRYKLLLLWDEILGTLMCPWVLMFHYSRCARSLLSFLQEHTSNTSSMGAICSYGSFQILCNSVLGDQKMSSSLLSFSQSYPSFCQGQQPLNVQ